MQKMYARRQSLLGGITHNLLGIGCSPSHRHQMHISREIKQGFDGLPQIFTRFKRTHRNHVPEGQVVLLPHPNSVGLGNFLSKHLIATLIDNLYFGRIDTEKIDNIAFRTLAHRHNLVGITTSPMEFPCIDRPIGRFIKLGIT